MPNRHMPPQYKLKQRNLKQRNLKQQGFTLLEILLVLMIAVALASLSTGDLQRLLHRVQLSYQTSLLIETLQHQALQARRSGQHKTFQVETNSLWLDQRIIYQAPEGSTLHWQPDRAGQPLSLFSDGSNSGGLLQLQPSGLPPSNVRLYWLSGEIRDESFTAH
ncbi:MAG: type II secretion system GspH family protein [Marinobacterium sp.]|nr:type II secretion system GspH family protein [Marinobacterium sp.]